MPYIKQEDRTKFTPSITNVLAIVNCATDNPYMRGEYFGYFVNRLARKFQNDSTYQNNFFNSNFFNEEKKKTLANCADKIAAMLNRADPINSAGELNYAVTAVCWGMLGQAKDAKDANYGMRTYLSSILQKIYDNIQSENNGSQKDATMSFRRHLIVRGVLRDVIAETDRRQNSYYEDEKRMENGDIWREGELWLSQAE